MTDRKLSLMGGLLLGGKSVRMGFPKGLAPLEGGQAMALPCLRALQVATEGVALLGGPLDLDGGEGLPILKDGAEDLGPLGGVEAALGSNLGDGWIILPWDMPQVSPGDLRPLVEALKEGASIAAYAHGPGPGGLIPFPLGIHLAALPALKGYLATGQRAVWRFVAQGRPTLLDPPPGDPTRFRGINTPEALRACPGSWLSHG